MSAKNQKYDSDQDSEDEQENLDTFSIPAPKKNIMDQFQGPIKPTQSFAKPPIKKSVDQTTNYGDKYAPKHWNEYFDSMDFLENGTSIFFAGNEGPLFVCLHGAGHSAQSFALLAKNIKKWGQCIAFDFKGHGYSKVENDYEMSSEMLINESLNIYNYLDQKFPNQTFVIVGHSMGGAIACKSINEAMKLPHLEQKIQGLVVIDVVEGTALEALPFMESIVKSRPQSFKSQDEAIRYTINSQTVKNLESAKVSIPPQLVEYQSEGQIEYQWKVDLMQSQKNWRCWFKGLTQSFLNIRIPKLLLLAEKDRMDTELTIAQMQGKFKLVVLYNVGHVMQEDDPKNTAINLHSYITMFKIPQNLDELEQIKQIGIGKFKTNIKPFE